jgi:hypothetical protein
MGYKQKSAFGSVRRRFPSIIPIPYQSPLFVGFDECSSPYRKGTPTPHSPRLREIIYPFRAHVPMLGTRLIWTGISISQQSLHMAAFKCSPVYRITSHLRRIGCAGSSLI